MKFVSKMLNVHVLHVLFVHHVDHVVTQMWASIQDIHRKQYLICEPFQKRYLISYFIKHAVLNYISDQMAVSGFKNFTRIQAIQGEMIQQTANLKIELVIFSFRPFHGSILTPSFIYSSDECKMP